MKKIISILKRFFGKSKKNTEHVDLPKIKSTELLLDSLLIPRWPFDTYTIYVKNEVSFYPGQLLTINKDKNQAILNVISQVAVITRLSNIGITSYCVEMLRCDDNSLLEKGNKIFLG